MGRKILYLINPISGTRAKGQLRNMVQRRTAARGIDFQILPTDAQGDYRWLKALIREESFSDVVVCGGDGTVNAVANALRDTDLRLGIIPMGSGNGLAFAARIPAQPSRALDLIFEGSSALIDAFRVNELFSCMLCGIGFDAQVAHTFAHQKRRGLQTYIQTTLQEFFKAKPYSFELVLPQKTIEVKAFFLCVANSNQFGNHVRIAPQASLCDGLLDVVVVKEMNKMFLPFSLLSQVTGINAAQPAEAFTDRRSILYFQTPRLVVRNPQGAPLHIDGEPMPVSQELSVEIFPTCIRLIQPHF